MVKTFTSDDRGSATQWFALTAVIVSIGCLAGAQGLAWLSQPGRVSIVAARGQNPAVAPTGIADAGIDPTPTGSVPKSSVMIRIH